MAYGNTTYRPTVEQYPLMEALAVAVAVDRAQGFVKSGHGTYDIDADKRIDDNRSTALRTLRKIHGTAAIDIPDLPLKTYLPTEADFEYARDVFYHFDQILLMKKMGDDLLSVDKAGRVNDFDEYLSKMFGNARVDVNKDLAMLVSLPHSRRMSDKREEMREFWDNNSNNGFIGNIKQRLKLTGKVMDVKYIPDHSIHLTTVVTEDGQIAKFFMNNKMSELAKTIDGKTITFVGTVKKQAVDNWSKCEETMFNRVKIDIDEA